MVTRWDDCEMPDTGEPLGICPCPDGGFVQFSDYAALEARVADLIEELASSESEVDAIADYNVKLQGKVAELENDAARYRAIMDNEWLDHNMQPSALREAAATKAGGMLEAVLDQCIDEA